MSLNYVLSQQSVGIASVFASIGFCYIVYSLSVALYNITFHPLAKIPGPLSRGAFYLEQYWGIWTGDLVADRKALHDRYGDTVRVAPDTVSFNNVEAWQEIYGQRQGKKPVPKDPEVYAESDGVAGILTANDADHTRIRRLLSHAFSESALREQEPLMNVYFDLLIQKLFEKVEGPTNGKVNIVRWYNFTTFDIIGDLCFGESFDALRTEEYNYWIANIFGTLRFLRFFRILRAYPLLGFPFLLLIRLFPSISEARKKHIQYTEEKSSRRLDTETDRRDFMSYVLRHNDEKGMSRREIMKTSSTLIIAGSETTATLLSGATFHLLKSPSALEKLTEEIRTTFPDAAELTFATLANLPYLNACLQEALRIYPPVAGTLARRTQAGGAIINGQFIPENVSVGVSQWCLSHSINNFAEPDKYIPERWLDDPRFTSDKRNSSQAFSVGPRNCLGQHLAMAEMRAILARVLWHFDISLCKESENWDQQKVFVLWDKPDLFVRLSARN